MRFGIVHHSLGMEVPLAEAMRIAYERGALLFAASSHNTTREELADLSAQYQMELISGFHDKFIEHGANQETASFEKFCQDFCVPLNIKVLGTCSTHHRWRKDPPLPEQLERLSAALSRLCKIAADYGVTFAIENHADYRAGDILEILERVNSPNLRVQLDTGNPYAVAEEPVDAARLLAPYTVSTHIKDMTIAPLTGGEWVKVLGSTLGEGEVDLVAIAKILAQIAPPDLPFMIEVEAHTDNPREAFEHSVTYIREALSDLVTFRSSACSCCSEK